MYCVCRNVELHQLSQLSHQSYMWFTICGGSHRSWLSRTWSSSAHVWQDVENYKICNKICTAEILWVLARIRMVSWPRITMRYNSTTPSCGHHVVWLQVARAIYNNAVMHLKGKKAVYPRDWKSMEISIATTWAYWVSPVLNCFFFPGTLW